MQGSSSWRDARTNTRDERATRSSRTTVLSRSAFSFAAAIPRAYVNAMRTIGTLASEKAAARFSDFLYVRGIENEFEREDDGTFSLWILDDAQMTAAADMLATFRTNPDAPGFDSARTAEEQRRAEAKAETTRRSTVADTARVGYEQDFVPTPYVTYVLILLSVVAAIFSNVGEDKLAIRHLFIADIGVNGDFIAWMPGLVEVRAGQVWRLITPIFIHFGLPHIAFDLMLLHTLGTIVESRFGERYFSGFVVVSAALSNLGQYCWSGPVFGGLSGIDYALFGFLWMRGKHDPGSNLLPSQNAVFQMIGWFVICLVGIIPLVANVCHAVGLAVGMAWGWLSAQRGFSR